MSFEEPKYHTPSMCDKCNKDVGKENLKPFPFIYKDMNDKCHPDLGDINPKFRGYRQYYGCTSCIALEKRITENKKRAVFEKYMYENLK